MTQLTLNFENPSLMSLFKKLANSMEGVSVATTKRKRKSSYERSLEDIAAGRVTEYDSVEDFFKHIDEL